MADHSKPETVIFGRLDETQLDTLLKRLRLFLSDPMWADHVELPKVFLKMAIEAIEAGRSTIPAQSKPSDDAMRITLQVLADDSKTPPWIATLCKGTLASAPPQKSQAKEPEASGGLCAQASHAVRVGEPTRIGAVVGDQVAEEPSLIPKLIVSLGRMADRLQRMGEFKEGVPYSLVRGEGDLLARRVDELREATLSVPPHDSAVCAYGDKCPILGGPRPNCSYCGNAPSQEAPAPREGGAGERCSYCDGSGDHPGGPPGNQQCPVCDGAGWLTERSQEVKALPDTEEEADERGDNGRNTGGKSYR